MLPSKAYIPSSVDSFIFWQTSTSVQINSFRMKMMRRCCLSLVAVMAADVAVTMVTGACVNTLKCTRAPSAITLDADLSDWSAIEGIATELRMVTQTVYKDGDATIKCVYDDATIYFAVEIPGLYRFNDTDYHQCPSIATMTKVSILIFSMSAQHYCE